MLKNDFWHFLGGVVLFVANIDWIIIPTILIPLFQFTLTTYIIAIVLANIELVMWYRFWRWFFVSWLARRKSIKETIEFTKGIANEAKKDEKVRGYLCRIIDRFENTFAWATNPKRWLWKIVKAGGHFGLLFLGFEPFFWGGRLVGTVFCATIGWKNGIYSLCLGNSLHVIITILSWKAGFRLGDYIWSYLFL